MPRPTQAVALAARRRRAANPERFAAAAATPASLKALLAVATMQSEQKAADALGVSQPAVHRALRALEHLAGETIFQRTMRGTRLTDAGEALLWGVKLAVGEARSLDSEIAAWRGEVRGRVVVGALPLSVSLLLPQAVDAVLREHPEVEITVVDGTYDSLMRQLRSADIDLVIGALRDAPVGVRQEALADEPLAVIVRAGRPCLRRRRLSVSDLRRWPWVVPLPGTPAAAALRRVPGAVDVEPPAGSLRSSSAVFTRAVVACSDRLALTSQGAARDEANPRRTWSSCSTPCAPPQASLISRTHTLPMLRDCARGAAMRRSRP